MRTYSVSDAMNCKNWSDMNAKMVKKRLDIENPAYRIVFLDDGGTITSALGGWTVYVKDEKWWDPPPIRHGDGSTFSFADGHSDYHKWKDPHTIEFGKPCLPWLSRRSRRATRTFTGQPSPCGVRRPCTSSGVPSCASTRASH